MKYSIIVPVFNRPDEVGELLDSLSRQTVKDFEVVIVEDGSRRPCKDVCDGFTGKLDIKYFMKENSGPGQSRNYGAEHASGDYLIILDSDVVLPESYLQAVSDELSQEETDAFGGPDRSHPSFTDTQKAISYSMTAFLTTGGIRGGKKKLDKFYPRSFNMGIHRDAYQALGGFSRMRFGEDIDLSIRIFKSGYRCRLFPGAWVWHKRRTDFGKFFRQVYNSGIARVNLYKKYPESLKLVHLLPTVFTVGVSVLVIIAIALSLFMASGSNGNSLLITSLPLVPIIFYALILFLDSAVRNKSIKIGGLSVAAAFIQLMGYGFGFISAWWKRCVMHQDEFQAFEHTFYK